MNVRLTVRGLAVAAVLLVVLTVGIGAALAGTSTDPFCGLCKSHRSHIEWSRYSEHAEVDCASCHTKPGPFSALIADLETLDQVATQFQGYEAPILGAATNQACRRCHTDDDLFRPISAGGIDVQHRHLVEAGFLCTRCHSTVGHGQAVPEGARQEPTMFQCLICHNNQFTSTGGEVATADCELCHTRTDYAAAPSTHETEAWGGQHGSLGILSTCSACHHDAGMAELGLGDTGAPACRGCHDGLVMPHPKSWLRRHGSRSEKLGEKTCSTCHSSEDYCSTCHQLPMPHPSGFVASHREAADELGTACLNCHKADNCQACHGEHRDGAPQGHQLFDGVDYELPVQPEAEPGTTLRR